MLRPVLLILLVAVSTLLACSDSPTNIAPETTGPPARLQIVTGSEQRGFAGQVLAQPIVVLVLDSAGRPVPNQPVGFLVAAGGGSVSADTVRSDSSGRSEVQWTLGEPGVLQTVQVRVPINPEATSFLFEVVSAVSEAAPTNLRFQAVYAGGLHSCGLSTEQRAYCWGTSAIDGDIDLVPAAVPGELTFSRLALGMGHTCGLTSDGSAYCWGDNREGQLGNGNRSSSTAPVAVSGGLVFQDIAAGYDHTCALTSHGAAYCWGNNESLDLPGGQLGDGTSTDRLVPTPVRGGLSFEALALGDQGSCGLDEKGAAFCWGRLTSRLDVPARLTPTAVSGGLTFTAISTGIGHACGLIASGAAYCWGRNLNDELGAGIQARDSQAPVAVQGGFRFRAIGAAAYHTCGLTLDGELACWGWDDDFIISAEFNGGTSIHSTEPVVVPGRLTFETLSEGMVHGCGMTTEETAYCWFDNGNGQLGTGNQVSSYLPLPVR